jgi:hypothetical protein
MFLVYILTLDLQGILYFHVKVVSSVFKLLLAFLDTGFLLDNNLNCSIFFHFDFLSHFKFKSFFFFDL